MTTVAISLKMYFGPAARRRTAPRWRPWPRGAPKSCRGRRRWSCSPRSSRSRPPSRRPGRLRLRSNWISRPRTPAPSPAGVRRRAGRAGCDARRGRSRGTSPAVRRGRSGGPGQDGGGTGTAWSRCCASARPNASIPWWRRRRRRPGRLGDPRRHRQARPRGVRAGLGHRRHSAGATGTPQRCATPPEPPSASASATSASSTAAVPAPAWWRRSATRWTGCSSGGSPRPRRRRDRLDDRRQPLTQRPTLTAPHCSSAGGFSASQRPETSPLISRRQRPRGRG